MEDLPLNSGDKESDSDDSISRYQQVSNVYIVIIIQTQYISDQTTSTNCHYSLLNLIFRMKQNNILIAKDYIPASKL